MNEKKKKETFQATQIIKLNLTKTGNCVCDVSIFTPWRYSKEEAIWAEKEQWSRNNMPNRKWFCLPNLSFISFWISKLEGSAAISESFLASIQIIQKIFVELF